MANVGAASVFKKVEGSRCVDFVTALRVLDASGNTAQGGQMYNRIDPSYRGAQSVVVKETGLAYIRLQTLNVLSVARRKVVEDPDGVTRLKGSSGQVVTDKACATGDQD
ncbi:hypothetical protein GCM10028781_11490 [Nostocoides australiense]